MSRTRWAVAAGLAVVIAFVGSSAYLFVRPRTGRTTRADALVILGPGLHGERFEKGMSLMKAGLARVLVVSRSSGGGRPARAICARRWRFEVICFRARPFSTRGEARELGRLASARGWTSVVVVTSTYHVERAGILFRRCYRRRLEMVAAEPRLSLVQEVRSVAHEWGGLVYALTFARGC
jgi:uncharacterized SAM-binding protein YcdF (DUF218 family)